MRLVWILLFALLLFLIYHRNTLSIVKNIAYYREKAKLDYQYENENKKRILPAWYEQKIPFKIHQTSFAKKMDYKLSTSALANHYVNPEYDYYFYDENACVSFIKENYPEYLECYNSLRPGAYKADLFRLLVIYKEGGVYIDDKTFSVRPLREFILPSDELYMPIDLLLDCVYQGIIISIPGHPIIKKCIDRYIANIKNRYYGVDPYDIGGPRMIGREINKFFGRSEFSLIQPIKQDGIRIEGNVKLLPKFDVIVSKDNQVFFERSNPSYLGRKVIQILRGKEYGSLWVLGKVYK